MQSRGNTRQGLLQQRTFLGMRVFAGNHVGNQTVLRIVEHQRLPRQGGGPKPAQLENTMLGAGQVVPIQDSYAVARQQRQGLRPHRLHTGAQFLARIMHQRRRDLRFQTLQLVIDSLPGHRNFVRVGLVERSHGRRFLEHHVAHDLNTLGESQFLGVAQDGVLLENLIQHRRFENTLKRCTDHHADRTPLDEDRQWFAQQHPCRSCFARPIHTPPPRCDARRSRSDTINRETVTD